MDHKQLIDTAICIYRNYQYNKVADKIVAYNVE